VCFSYVVKHFLHGTYSHYLNSIPMKENRQFTALAHRALRETRLDGQLGIVVCASSSPVPLDKACSTLICEIHQSYEIMLTWCLRVSNFISM